MEIKQRLARHVNVYRVIAAAGLVIAMVLILAAGVILYFQVALNPNA